MYTRLNDVPVFKTLSVELDAVHFNHVQTVLNRHGGSIRIQIPRLKHLDLILEKEAWIIVDRVLEDVPIAAWTDFEVAERDNLHMPIKCKQRLYHVHAHLVLDHSLEAMELVLGEQFSKNYTGNPESVVSNIKEK